MSPGPPTKRRWLKALLSVAVSAGLLAWLASRSDTDALLDLIKGMRPGWFLLAAALIPLQVILSAARWRRVAEDLSMPMEFSTAVREYGLSMFLNQVLPGGMTGDGVRVWRHKRGHGSVGAPLRAAVVERASGHVAHLVLTLVGLLLWTEVHASAPPPGTILLVVLLLGLFASAVAVPGRIPGLGAAAMDARLALGRIDRLVFHVVVSGLLLATFLAGFAACAAALGLNLGWGVLTAIPLVMLVMVVPLSIGGWGLREASAATVLAHLGWSTESALALSAVYGMSVLVGSLPGAAVLGGSGPAASTGE